MSKECDNSIDVNKYINIYCVRYFIVFHIYIYIYINFIKQLLIILIKFNNFLKVFIIFINIYTLTSSNIITAATDLKYVKAKLEALNVMNSDNFKVSFLMDIKAMISIKIEVRINQFYVFKVKFPKQCDCIYIYT